MGNKIDQFLAKSKEVTIVLEDENGNLREEKVTVRPRNTNHNLKLARFIIGLMQEGDRLSQLDFSKDGNVVDQIMTLLEDKLEELVELIAPDAKKEWIGQAFLESWAEVLNEYIDINFRTLVKGFQKAFQTVGGSSKR